MQHTLPARLSDEPLGDEGQAPSRFKTLVKRFVDLGVDKVDTVAETRWVRTINVVALASLVICLAYSVTYAFLDLATLWPVVLTNMVWNCGYVAVIVINRRGYPRMASWLALFVGLANTVLPAMFIGAAAGVFLFIALVPMVGVQLSGPTDNLMRTTAIALGVIAFAVTPMVFVDAPEVIAGTRAERFLFFSSAIGVALFGSFFAFYYRWLVDQAERALAEANATSERLLLNILPGHIAERLKTDDSAIADRIDQVTVLFADIVDSTLLAERLPADELVSLLDRVFSEFDEITEANRLEKVATIGDCYFAVAGLQGLLADPAAAAVDTALAMRDAVTRYEVPGHGPLGVRFGLAMGPVVAGVIGKRKFRYDLWGDTVNTASRMQSHGEPGRIHVTARIQHALDGRYECEPRGQIWIKGKGLMETYFLERRVTADAVSSAAEPVAG